MYCNLKHGCGLESRERLCDPADAEPCGAGGVSGDVAHRMLHALRSISLSTALSTYISLLSRCHNVREVQYPSQLVVEYYRSTCLPAHLSMLPLTFWSYCLGSIRLLLIKKRPYQRAARCSRTLFVVTLRTKHRRQCGRSV
jgi:hypothetical protein